MCETLSLLKDFGIVELTKNLQRIGRESTNNLLCSLGVTTSSCRRFLPNRKPRSSRIAWSESFGLQRNPLREFARWIHRKSDHFEVFPVHLPSVCPPRVSFCLEPRGFHPMISPDDFTRWIISQSTCAQSDGETCAGYRSAIAGSSDGGQINYLVGKSPSWPLDEFFSRGSLQCIICSMISPSLFSKESLRKFLWL